MKQMLCSICNRKIGILGWGKHTKMHKKALGNDCYDVVRIAKRQGSKLPYREQQTL